MPSNRYSGDVFGKKISDSTRNNADIAGHYPYSPERWRFFENSISESNRLFLEYTDDSRYDHQGFNGRGNWDLHTIKPNAGDTLIFKTAERFRYVVGYESVPTWAFSINKALQSGDRITIGPTDFTDGWACRFSGDLGENQYKFIQFREGNETKSPTFSLSKPITSYTRHEWRYAWYEIMGVLHSQSYGFDNWQTGQIQCDGNLNGPSIGNQPLSCKIEASSTGLEIYLGSCAWQTKGDVDSIVRDKTFKTPDISYGGSNEWQPLYVIRKDSKRNYIQAQIDQVTLTRFGGNADVFTIVMVMSKQNVRDSNGNLLDDTDFGVPNELSDINSIFQTSTSVAQIPDSNGNIVTTASDPGGYQVGYSSLYTATGSGPEREGSQNTIKRRMNDDDYMVILGKSTASGSITNELLMQQSW